MTILPHIEKLLARLSLDEKHPRSYNLTLSGYQMITTCDAVAMFNARPEMDILFVYFRKIDGRELNVGFQRCFLACKPIAKTLGVLDTEELQRSGFLETAGHPIDNHP